MGSLSLADTMTDKVGTRASPSATQAVTRGAPQGTEIGVTVNRGAGIGSIAREMRDTATTSETAKESKRNKTDTPEIGKDTTTKRGGHKRGRAPTNTLSPGISKIIRGLSMVLSQHSI